MPKKRVATTTETDSAYFLKILIYFIVGTIWIKVNGIVVVPIGLLFGLLLTSHDHFKIDRKVEYAILLIAAILGLIGVGLFINLH